MVAAVPPPPALLLALLASAALPRGAALDPHAVSYSLVAAGKACSNSDRELSAFAGSAQACAELVCADPLCGPFFEDRSHQGGRCACLSASQACAEVSDPDSNRYEISDTSQCEPRQIHDCFALVYENGDFTGWSASFPEGFHSAEDFTKYGGEDDGASSVYISGEGCEATFFGNSDFTGWTITVAEGSYSVEDLVALGFKDNDVSAVAVHYGALPDVGAEAAEDRRRSEEEEEGAEAERQQEEPSRAHQEAGEEAEEPAHTLQPPSTEPAPAEPALQQADAGSAGHGWGAALWERLSGTHREEPRPGPGDQPREQPGDQPQEPRRAAAEKPDAHPQERAPTAAPSPQQQAPTTQPPPRAPQRKPMVLPRGLPQGPVPPWAKLVATHIWQDIPSWVRTNMTDALACDPSTQQQCDEQERSFIRDVTREICSGEECSLDHAHGLLSEAKRVAMKRMTLTGERRTWLEKRASILFMLYARLGHAPRKEL